MCVLSGTRRNNYVFPAIVSICPLSLSSLHAYLLWMKLVCPLGHMDSPQQLNVGLHHRRWSIPSAHSSVHLPLRSLCRIEPRSSNPAQLARLVAPFTTSFSHCNTPTIDLYTLQKEIHATEQSPRLFGIVGKGGKQQCVLTSGRTCPMSTPDARCIWHRRTPRIPHVSQLFYYIQPYNMTLHVLSIGSG